MPPKGSRTAMPRAGASARGQEKVALQSEVMPEAKRSKCSNKRLREARAQEDEGVLENISQCTSSELLRRATLHGAQAERTVPWGRRRRRCH